MPLTTERLLALVRAAGIDALDVAWIDTPQVEAAIAASDAVAFTGSTHTGRRIAELAGRHIKKSVLELGGSNPCIVLADADIALAAEEAAHSRFRDAGQSCNAAKRMVLAPEIAEDFLQAFLDVARRLQSGDPRDLPTGQRIYAQRLTSLSEKITYVVVCGDAETMEVKAVLPIAKGKLHGWQNCDLEGLFERIRRWSTKAKLQVVSPSRAAA